MDIPIYQHLSSPSGGRMSVPLPLIRRLVRALEPLRLRALPEPVLEKARVCLLDYLAASCAGMSNPTAVAAGKAAVCFGPGECTLFGRAGTGSVAAAALHNGLVGHAEELDDSHRYVSGLHSGAVIWPAALALAEARDLDGAAVVRAAVCGYEAAGRLCRCMDKAHRERGFHSTGTAGPFGAAAACGVLLGLDGDRLAHALGLAASSAAGLFAFLEDGATVKHFHAGRAALDGLSAALLAEGGLTGPARVLEAKEGFFHAYAGRFDPAPLDADSDMPEILCAYHKLHSACGHTFPAVDAALALWEALQRRGQGPEVLASLSYRTYAAGAVLNKTAPATAAEARFSIPLVLALALTRGHVFRSDLTPGTLADPLITDLCRRVEVREDPALSAAFPRRRAGCLEAALADGTCLTFRVDSPRGMPDNPAGAPDLERKFLTEAAAVLPAPRLQPLRDLAAGVDRLASVRPLLALLRACGPERNPGLPSIL